MIPKISRGMERKITSCKSLKKIHFSEHITDFAESLMDVRYSGLTDQAQGEELPSRIPAAWYFAQSIRAFRSCHWTSRAFGSFVQITQSGFENSTQMPRRFESFVQRIRSRFVSRVNSRLSTDDSPWKRNLRSLDRNFQCSIPESCVSSFVPGEMDRRWIVGNWGCDEIFSVKNGGNLRSSEERKENRALERDSMRE
jgi:hypothetical protein